LIVFVYTVNCLFTGSERKEHSNVPTKSSSTHLVCYDASVKESKVLSYLNKIKTLDKKHYKLFFLNLDYFYFESGTWQTFCSTSCTDSTKQNIFKLFLFSLVITVKTYIQSVKLCNNKLDIIVSIWDVITLYFKAMNSSKARM